ncbi:MAG: response regulator [Bryobacteraceae bacterium]
MGRIWFVLALATVAMAQEGAGDTRASGPKLSAVSVVNAADYHSGAVAPSEIVVLYPTDAGPSRMVPWALDAVHLSPYSVDTLGGTRVLFDGFAAPMVYAERGRICVIVPYQVAGRKTTEVVVEYQGQRSSPVVLPVVGSAPALFTLDASGVGQAAMLNETGCCNSVRNPAVRGTIASLFATGEGLPLPGAAKTLVAPLPVRVAVGGVPAQIEWTGNVGVLQVNFRIPVNAPVGDAVPLVLTVGNAHGTAETTMAIRSQRQQILAVAGDLACRRRLSAILTGAGYDVFGARDGVQAILLTKDRTVDLVITDLALPPTERANMMRAIRDAHQQVKTLAIVDSLSLAELKAADLLGAQAVLTTPLAARSVLERVRALLRRRPAVY